MLQGVRGNTLGIRLPSLVVPVLKDKAHKLDLMRRKVRYRGRIVEKIRRTERPMPSHDAKMLFKKSDKDFQLAYQKLTSQRMEKGDRKRR